MGLILTKPALAIARWVFYLVNRYMKEKNYRPETLAIRAGQERSRFGEHSEPLYLTSGFVFESAAQAAARFNGDEEGPVYGRITNPTVQAFERKLAALEGAEYCITTATGMAAINAIMMGLLSQGDHIVASSSLFGATIVLFEKILKRFGVSVTYVDIGDKDGWEQAAQSSTKLFFVETPTNPLCELEDIQFVADIAHRRGALLVVDSTYSTPILQTPLQLGADIVVHSGTKYLDGQGRVMAGAICLNDKQTYDDIFSIIRTAGASLSPMNAWVMNQGLHTLSLRMRQHCDNALTLANWLTTQDAVDEVFYPGLETSAHHQLACVQQSGFGGMLSFSLKGGQAAAWKLIDQCELISISVNLGDSRSIITHPASTTHVRLSDEERARCGITNSLLRFSVGLEAADDLIDDLSASLN